MEKMFLTTVKYNKDQIKDKRFNIRKDLMNKSANIKSGKITEISIQDLNLIFQLYDYYFLNSYFKQNFTGILDFSLSKRLTRSAGVTVKYKNSNERYEIKIGINFFFKFDELNRDKLVNGIYAKDSLDALLLVMEHEMCHLIEFHIFGDSNCGGSRFKEISINLFNHNGRYHQLPTNLEIANEKFGLKVGDNVYFQNGSKVMKGIIYTIKVRATVMVFDQNGRYSDNNGEKYTKWYVPLGELKPIITDTL